MTETIDQMEMAITAGCKLAQGFLFSKPIPKDEVIDFIKNFDVEGNTIKIGGEIKDFDFVEYLYFFSNI